MKTQIRVLGIDDAPFSFSDKYVNVIGVIMRGGGYLEGVLKNQIHIDGLDATQSIKEMIENSRYMFQLKAIMIDGIALGGFNIVDIDKLNAETKIPVITITRDYPNFEKIKVALQKNFNDWETRWDILSQGELKKIKTAHNPIYVKTAGIPLRQAEEIIKISTIRGVLPEPIRMAHLIASGITTGGSHGKA